MVSTVRRCDGASEGARVRRCIARTAACLSVVAALASIGAGPKAGQETPAADEDPFALLESFLGMDSTVGGLSPDVSLAVGHGHLLIVRNTGLVLWRKASSQTPAEAITSTSLARFFAPVGKPGDRLTDPWTLYDAEAGRFFVVNAAYNTCPDCGSHLLAVSQSAFPETLGEDDWYFYRFDRGLERTTTGTTRTSNDGDYDNLAVAGNKLAIAWMATRHPDGGGSVEAIGGRVRLLDKRMLMAGVTPDTWVDLLPSAPTNARARLASVPDRLDRATEGSRLFVDFHSGPPCGTPGRWIIGAVTALDGAPVLTTREFTSPAFSCSNPPVASQPDGARPMNINHLGVHPIYRNGRLWVFEVRGAGPQDRRAAILWMELDVQSWPTSIRLVQSGLYSEPGVSVFAPAATLDSGGNLVIVYTRSGPTEHPSIYYTGRLATDPPNTLRASRVLRRGTRSFDWNPSPGTGQSFNQFIDYGTATVDPVDGSIWITALVPAPEGRLPSGFERSDAWIGRVRPRATR